MVSDYDDAVEGTLDALGKAGAAKSHKGIALLLASAQVTATLAVAAATKELVELLRIPIKVEVFDADHN